MFCSVNDSACLEISVPGVGTDTIDLPAASKNLATPFSSCSMVFSATPLNSAGTSSFGSIMPSSSGLNGALPQFQNGVSRLLLPLARRVPELDQGRGPAFQAAQIIARRIGS